MADFSRKYKYETQNIQFAIICIIHDMYECVSINKGTSDTSRDTIYASNDEAKKNSMRLKLKDLHLVLLCSHQDLQ